LLFAISNNSQAHEDDTLLKAGVALYYQGDYEKALLHFRQCISHADQARDTLCLILGYRNVGNVYSRLGKPVEALKAYQQSVRLADASGDKRSGARSIMNIGALYEEMKNFEQAIPYYNKAEEIALAIPDSSILADCANNYGVIFEQQEKYREALAAYQQALQIYEKLDNSERIGLALNNIGIVYKFLGDYPTSIRYYQRSLDLAESTDDHFLAAANLTNMGNVFTLMGDYSKAISHQQRSLGIARRIDAVNIIIEATSSLADACAKAGNYRMAYDYYQQYVQANDSFLNQERSRQIADLQTKYETEKKEQEIVALKQAANVQMMQLNNQHLLVQRRNFHMLAISAIVLLGGIATFLFFSRQKLKQEQLREKAVMDTEYRERLRIARDVHDDLGSGLSRISLIAELAGKKAGGDHATGTDIRHIARMSKELVDNMRDLIWVLNPEHASLDNLIARIREFSSDYLDENHITSVFNLPQDLPEVKISREFQRNVFLTIKEAMHNVVKHAEATQVQITLRLEDEMMNMSIEDNGKGMELPASQPKGNGLRNMKQRVEALGGSYRISTVPGKGTAIEISLSVPLLSRSASLV